LLPALSGLVLAAVLAALTALAALAALMLLTRPVLRALAALTTLPAALLRTLLLLIALRVLLLIRHWEILRLLVWEKHPPPPEYQRVAETEVPKSRNSRYGQRIVTTE
jgi:hypothetical protein